MITVIVGLTIGVFAVETFTEGDWMGAAMRSFTMAGGVFAMWVAGKIDAKKGGE